MREPVCSHIGVPQRRPETSRISEPTVRSITERFLGIGETVFDVVQSTAVNSDYFKRTGRGPPTP